MTEIYRANPLEDLKNECFRLQRLQERGSGGKSLEVSILLKENWDKITEIVEQQDKRRLGTLRERINDIIKEEHEQGNNY